MELELEVIALRHVDTSETGSLILRWARRAQRTGDQPDWRCRGVPARKRYGAQIRQIL